MHKIRQENERKLTGGLIRLARVYRKEVNRALSAYGISDAQAVPVLHIARCGGGMRQHQLAEEIGIKGPSLVRLLDQLCAHGLVERRDDGLDRRAKNLHLTAAGAALAARVEAVLTQVREQLLSSIDDRDLTAALRVIAVLQEALDQGRAAPQSDEAA
jgi:MarR family transcriptional regulator, transcriptional regulator for hemolysin